MNKDPYDFFIFMNNDPYEKKKTNINNYPYEQKPLWITTLSKYVSEITEFLAIFPSYSVSAYRS